MNILFFDTETIGLPRDYKAPVSDVDNWPRMVQLAFSLFNDNGQTHQFCEIIKPEGFVIPEEMTAIHGISHELAMETGITSSSARACFVTALSQADLLVGHNISFDRKVVGAEMIRSGFGDLLHGKPRICTMFKSTQYCQLVKEKGNGYKWPKLEELYFKLFGVKKEGLHNAGEDVAATADCYFQLRLLGVIDDQDIEKELSRKEIESF